MLFPPRSKRSPPAAISARTFASVSIESRASFQCPCANITPGTLPLITFGFHRLPVTKNPGALSKYTFSTVKPSPSTFPCTTAFSGVFVGIGHSPSATKICRRT